MTRTPLIQPRPTVRIVSQRLTLLSACLLVVAGPACRPHGDQISSDESTVTVLYIGDERILGPYWEMPAQFLMFLPLVTLDQSGQMQPRLAQRWEHSSDYREWTFHLQQDVRWHDGIPVTAHDIKFSLELFAHPDVLFGGAGQGIKSITVPDDSTLRITYTQPTDARDTWMVYYPRHLLKDLEPKEFFRWEFWTHPVGNGPYRYVRHVPKTMIALEANPDFYKGRAKIDGVVLKFGGSSALTELLSGNVDAITSVSRAAIPKLAGDPRFRVYDHGYPSGWLYAIYWNHGHPLFRDATVRRALTLAINRRELAQVLNLPENVPIFDVIFTNQQFLQRKLGQPLPYDPVRAKKLLEEAGWHDGDGDGIRERAEEKFRFTAMVPGRELDVVGMQKAAIYVQAQLRKIGVSMEVQPLDSTVLRPRLWAGDFEAAFHRFWNATTGHLSLFGEKSSIGYSNPKVIELLKAAQITMDPDAKGQIYRELMDIFREDMPLTFLFPQIQTFVAHRRLRGLHSPYWGGTLRHMEDLWLEDEEEEPE